MYSPLDALRLACLVCVIASSRSLAQPSERPLERRLAVKIALSDINAAEYGSVIALHMSGDSAVKFPEPIEESNLLVVLLDSIASGGRTAYIYTADLPSTGTGQRMIAVSQNLDAYPLFGFRLNRLDEFATDFTDGSDSSFHRLAVTLTRVHNIRSGYRGFEFTEPPGARCDPQKRGIRVETSAFRQSVVLWSALAREIEPQLVHSVRLDLAGFTITTIELDGRRR